MTYRGTYGERVAEIREYHPSPSFYDGTLWIVSVDGDPVHPGECHVDLDDAKATAESKVGHAMTWREES